MIFNIKENALPGNYICCQCGKNIKHEKGKIKRCDNCKGTQFMFTDKEKLDLSEK